MIRDSDEEGSISLEGCSIACVFIALACEDTVSIYWSFGNFSPSQFGGLCYDVIN